MGDRVASTPVGEIVAGDFRTAAVFDRFGIDFCCDGRQPFDEACRLASADPSEVARALDALPPAAGAPADPALWPPHRLVDHIVSTHHAYVRASMPVIAAHLDALAAGQREDGGWTFNWVAWSPAAEADWRGALTVDALATLRAHGRF